MFVQKHLYPWAYARIRSFLVLCTNSKAARCLFFCVSDKTAAFDGAGQASVVQQIWFSPSLTRTERAVLMHVTTNRQLPKFMTKAVQFQTWIYPMGLVWKDIMHPQCQLSRRAWTWAPGPTTPSPTAALKHPTNPDCRLRHSLAPSASQQMTTYGS